MNDTWENIVKGGFAALFVLFVALLISALLDRKEHDDVQPVTRVVEVDGHEYIYIRTKDASILEHRINCRFCKDRESSGISYTDGMYIRGVNRENNIQQGEER